MSLRRVKHNHSRFCNHRKYCCVSILTWITKTFFHSARHSAANEEMMVNHAVRGCKDRRTRETHEREVRDEFVLYSRVHAETSCGGFSFTSETRTGLCKGIYIKKTNETKDDSSVAFKCRDYIIYFTFSSLFR